jgi:predicted secreted Zn-dependent protease
VMSEFVSRTGRKHLFCSMNVCVVGTAKVAVNSKQIIPYERQPKRQQTESSMKSWTANTVAV